MGLKYELVFKNDTINLTKHPQKEDYWLYDKRLGYNVAMHAKTERDAFVQATDCYQRAIARITSENKSLRLKVDAIFDMLSDDIEE